MNKALIFSLIIVLTSCRGFSKNKILKTTKPTPAQIHQFIYGLVQGLIEGLEIPTYIPAYSSCPVYDTQFNSTITQLVSYSSNFSLRNILPEVKNIISALIVEIKHLISVLRSCPNAIEEGKTFLANLEAFVNAPG